MRDVVIYSSWISCMGKVGINDENNINQNPVKK